MDTREPSPTPRESTQASPWRRIASISGGLFFAMALTYVVPALHTLRPWSPGDSYVPFWNVVGREFLGEGKKYEEEARRLEAVNAAAKTSAAPLVPQEAPAGKKPPTPKSAAVQEEQTTRPLFPEYVSPHRVEKPAWGIEPPEALEPYYRKLTLVDLGVPGAIARAGHWGDSILGMDGITSTVRSRLQARFGDAGHGFHYISRYNPSYQQKGIVFEGSAGWDRCLIVFECRRRIIAMGTAG
jgi:hypothetical protein